MGAGLVLVDLGQAGVDGRVMRCEPVDAGEPEVAAEFLQVALTISVHHGALAFLLGINAPARL